MIKTDRPVIVEGKYDKIRLSNIIDGIIITTDGFGIFKDNDKKELIKLLAQKNGVIVLTDSDNAGKMIRTHLKKIIPNDKIINIYLPEIFGKEPRKTHKSAQGLLGVEGIDDDIIISAFERFNIGVQTENAAGPEITKTDLYALGIYGGDNSGIKRKSLLKYMLLPENLTADNLIEVINYSIGKEKFAEVYKNWLKESDRN